MSKINQLPVNTEPYAKLAKVRMTVAEREEAVYALGLGEAIAEVILWVSDGIRRRFAGAATKPGFKGQVAA